MLGEPGRSGSFVCACVEEGKEGGREGKRDPGAERETSAWTIEYLPSEEGGRGKKVSGNDTQEGGREGRREGKRAQSEKGNGNTGGSKRESCPCVWTRPWTSSDLSSSLPPLLPFHSPPVSSAVCQTQRRGGGREGGEGRTFKDSYRYVGGRSGGLRCVLVCSYRATTAKP